MSIKQNILIIVAVLAVVTVLYGLKIPENTAIKSTDTGENEYSSNDIENTTITLRNIENNNSLEVSGVNAEKNQTSALDNNIFKKQKNGMLLSAVLPDDIEKIAEKEFYSKEFQDKWLVDMGFNKEAVAKFDLKNPNVNLLSIKDAPKNLRDLVAQQLEDDKKKGVRFNE